MYKSANEWKPCTVQYDSEAESTPLLSSDSHLNIKPAIFESSECSSNLECISMSNCFKYGSVDTSCLYSNVTILPKGVLPLSGDHASSLTLSTSTLSVRQDRYSEISNTTLAFNSEKYKPKDTKSLSTNLTNTFLSTSYSLQQGAVEGSCKDNRSKQNSLVTIFSVWNTILGSSLLTIPWGIEMTGFFPGIFLILLMSGLCLYTAHCLLLVHKYHGGPKGTEVTQLCRIYLNKWAEYVAKIFSITVLLGATIAYWVLMSNFLYNSVNFIYNSITRSDYPLNDNTSHPSEVLCPKKLMNNNTNIVAPDYTHSNLETVWDLYKTVPVFLGLLIFPFLNFKSPTFFTKFNSLGTISVIYLIIFVLIKSSYWGINMNSKDWEISWRLKPAFPALSGMLALSYFIHNIIITVMQNNREQSKNGRDLSIAYLLVTLTYIIVGVVFYICFPLSKLCIEDNLLNNFEKWSFLTVGARIVLLFQLLTVYPLLAYMLRVQLLASICKTFNTGCVILVNVVLVCLCILFAVFVPYIGTIIRYTGALSGFIYIFTLPSLLYLAILKQQRKLTIFSVLLHTSIPIFGFLNLLAQFFITDA